MTRPLFEVHAEPDEPVFVLAGRDADAPEAIEVWASSRALAIARGWKPRSDIAQVREALGIAQAMRRWRAQRFQTVASPPSDLARRTEESLRQIEEQKT
jgi:hypothetical protein